MCWISEKTPVKQIAEQDIKVKKVLSTTYHYPDGSPQFRSPCNIYTIWKKGVVKSVDKRSIKSQVNRAFGGLYHSIDFGLHSAKRIRIIRGTINDSFVSVNSNNRASTLFTVDEADVVCTFIIPKGSTYYVNERDEYVSDALMFVDVCPQYRKKIKE